MKQSINSTKLEMHVLALRFQKCIILHICIYKNFATKDLQFFKTRFKLVPKVPCSFFGVINNEIKLLIERM